MHIVHTTPGFIVGSRPYGEAGKLISIFTRDFGLVTAVAQGIRLEKSKLRYSAQDDSFGEFSFVRGKEFWRLTSADGERAPSRGASEVIARASLILRRLLQGEDANLELFGCLERFIAFVSSREVKPEELAAIESLIVFKMLASLGYVAPDAETEAFAGDRMDESLLAVAGAKRTLLNKHINKALQESHL